MALVLPVNAYKDVGLPLPGEVMRYRSILWVSAWLLGGAALAQAPPGSDDIWGKPEPAANATAFLPVAPSLPGATGRSPFRFTDGREGSVLNLPPPQPSDRDAVLGTGRPWMGGRPPLDCAITPLDAKCH